MKRENRSLKYAVFAAVSAACAGLAQADLVVNGFDSASEVSQWRFDYGDIDGHTESFSTDDANGNPSSGSLDMLLNINTTTKPEYGAYTRDAFFPGIDGSPFLTLDMDVKVVPGSGADQFNQSGYFQLWLRNTDSYNFVQQFGDNLTAGGWRHISVPLTAPSNAIRALTFQLYANQNGITTPVDLRVDNVRFVTSAPPGTLRAGHQFSFEASGDIDSNHPSSAAGGVWGDSYDGSPLPVQTQHTQSTRFPTAGARTLKISQPLNTFTVGTQVVYNSGDSVKFNGLTQGTKILIDTTTPGHGPGYQTLETDINEAGGYYSAYGERNYQLVFGNPGGATTRTDAQTQTYTWDYGGQMLFKDGGLFVGLSNYVILHVATGNGGAATGDPSPTSSSEYYLDNVRVVNEDTLTRPTWQTISSAEWTTPANWANGVPNAAGKEAIFYGINAGTGDTTVSANVGVNAAITVGSIVFDSQMTSFQYEGASASITDHTMLPNTVNYTLAGTGSLTFDSNALGTSEIYAIAGSHTISVPVNANSNLELDTSAGFGSDENTSLPGGGRYSHVSMTSLAFTAPISIASGKSVTTHGPGTFSFAGVTGASSGLVINGGHANLGGDVNVGSFFVSAAGTASLAAGGARVLRTGIIGVTGTLNLNDNKAIVDYTGASPLADVKAAVTAGYSSGSWSGAGITSGLAASVAADGSNTHKTAVGYGEAGALGITSFAGQSVDSTSILMRYTYTGDANLDGKVNALDFNAVATSFGGTGKSWSDADFNFDGTVTTSDFTALSGNFGLALPSPVLGTLVPEPGSILAVVGIGMLAARRRGRLN